MIRLVDCQRQLQQVAHNISVLPRHFSGRRLVWPDNSANATMHEIKVVRLDAYRRSTEIQDLTKSGRPQGISNAEVKLAGGPHGAGRR